MKRATITALATGAVLLGASAVAAAQRPPDNPEGATVAAGARSVAAGGSLPFSGTGFAKEDGTGGQIVVVKLDDSKVLGEFPAAADGALSGSVTVPAGTSVGAHWLRFLAGSGGLNGQGGTGEPPARSLTANFTVTAAPPPAGEPPPGGTQPPPSATVPRLRLRSTTLRAGDRSVAVRIACTASVACPATVTVRRRGVTLARARLTVAPQSAKTVRAKLTRRGRALLRRDPRVRVRVRVAARNGHGAARTLTLRRR
jgi:hypothetical protein